jgi:signal peptidase I
MFSSDQQTRLDDLFHAVRKKINYDKDILNEKDLSLLEKTKAQLKSFSFKDKSKEQAKAELDKVEASVASFIPKGLQASIIENVEVLVLAIVIALGVRAYFIQPFKIPTHSMKPTLYGVYVEPATEPAPAFYKRVLDFLIEGKSYVELDVTEAGKIEGWEQKNKRFLGVWPQSESWIKIGEKVYHIDATIDEFIEGTGFNYGDRVPAKPLRFTLKSGDHLFVNKMSYYFRKPERGEVFIFTTQGIPKIQNRLEEAGIEGSQYYIKRCVGLPGDTLKIDPPFLYVNGEIIRKPKAFERIYSMENGYRGYSQSFNFDFLRTNDEIVKLDKDRYWAMGDNSLNSADSRDWGTVPAKDLVGTGLIVYWPFTKRWGWID